MRIDACNKVSQLYQANSTSKVVKSSNRGGKDTIELSQEAKDYQVATMAIKSSSDIRMDRVEAVRSQLASGTYDFSSKGLAEKLVEKRYFDEKM